MFFTLRLVGLSSRVNFIESWCQNLFFKMENRKHFQCSISKKSQCQNLYDKTAKKDGLYNAQIKKKTNLCFESTSMGYKKA